MSGSATTLTRLSRRTRPIWPQTPIYVLRLPLHVRRRRPPAHMPIALPLRTRSYQHHVSTILRRVPHNRSKAAEVAPVRAAYHQKEPNAFSESMMVRMAIEVSVYRSSSEGLCYCVVLYPCRYVAHRPASLSVGGSSRWHPACPSDAFLFMSFIFN